MSPWLQFVFVFLLQEDMVHCSKTGPLARKTTQTFLFEKKLKRKMQTPVTTDHVPLSLHVIEDKRWTVAVFSWRTEIWRCLRRQVMMGG